jgi:hypothetical protein
MKGKMTRKLSLVKATILNMNQQSAGIRGGDDTINLATRPVTVCNCRAATLFPAATCSQSAPLACS